MHPPAVFNRIVVHSISPRHTAAFLVPASFRHIRSFPLPAHSTSIVSPRSHSVIASAKAKSLTTRVSRKSNSTTQRSRSSSTSSSKSSESNLPTLVIVESPAKASTIQSILPSSEYIVRSCVGHIREIPSSAKRIPAKYKQYDWASLGVDVTSDFQPIYVLISGKQSLITDLRSELRRSSRLVLATDDDREGEAISWHLLEVLKPTVPVHRAVFHEITPSAIHSAFENFRSLNMALVDAQETRRVLDRLAGYTMSPLLWKKIARGLSAGRVQSVAMSEIVRRERERLQFKTANFAGCAAKFLTSSSKSFHASISAIDGIRLVRGSDFADKTGKLKDSIKPDSVRIYNRREMQQLCEAMEKSSSGTVSSVECRGTTRHPPPPLITSTLQQECGNRLGMGAGRTMGVAQKLYETGMITYMRTDNPTLSDDAIVACRASIEKLYGKEALSKNDDTETKKRRKKSGKKPKAAQAAHEAIRPAGDQFLHPDDVKGLSDAERAVYGIIYRRALASQMASAKLDQTTIKLNISLGDGVEIGGRCEREVQLKATGSVIVNPGFLLLYQDAHDETDTTAGPKPTASTSTFLPPLAADDVVNLRTTNVLDHETKPPPRFNDASLVKVLEEKGVGRPSTYAGIIEKLITRGYVYRGRDLPPEKKVPSKAMVPSLMAFAVESLLSENFPSFVDADFTARMEKVLDEIAAGSTNRTCYLNEYYSGGSGLAESVKRKEQDIDARRFKQVILPNMPMAMLESAAKEAADDIATQTTKSKSKNIPKRTRKTENKIETTGDKESNSKSSIRKTKDGEIDWHSTKVLVNSYGPYIEQDGTIVASLPKTTLADDLSPSPLENFLQLADDPVIGTDPESNLDVLLKTSSFGPYIQLGRETDVEEGKKPKRCGLARMDVGNVTLEVALKLLSLPRLLGTHPNSGEEIRAAIGPYGPYVVHGTTYVSLKKDEHDVLEINFAEALGLIEAAEARKQKRLEAQKLKAEKLKEEKEKEKEAPKSPKTKKRTPKATQKSKLTSTKA